MENAETVELIERFITHFSRCLQWRNCNKLTMLNVQPTEPGSPAEADFLNRIRDGHDREMDAVDEAVRVGRLLVEALVSINKSAGGVLKLIHFVHGGGGPDNAYSLWPDVKVDLQELARKLRQSSQGASGDSACTWKPRPGFIGTKTICHAVRFKKTKNGVTRNPAPSTIGRWKKCRPPTETDVDPTSGEIHYPEKWVLDWFDQWRPMRNAHA